MSNGWDDYDAEAARQELAARTGRTTDPLAEVVPQVAGLDPFKMYYRQVLMPKGLKDNTLETYRSTFNTYSSFMDGIGRHPACPSKQHISSWIESEREVGNSDPTIQGKLAQLDRAYRWWADDPQFPHTSDYNPFKLAWDQMEVRDNEKQQYRLTVDDLREHVGRIKNVRDRAIVVVGLKLGLRGSEVRNIQLRELSLTNEDVREHYPEMGTASPLEGRPNAIYIPPSSERENNKSKRPRVLPLDRDLQRAILQYLLIRPDNGEPWLFLSQTNHGQIKDTKDISRAWKETFPEYRETATRKGIESHYGRHRFTTWWRVEKDVNRDLVKYMRGDKANTMAYGNGSLDAIDKYIHTYYEDIEELYRDDIYKLNIS